MRPLLLFAHERRHHLGGDADRAPGGLVDDRPLGSGADARFAVLAGEFHEPIEARALRLLADPSAGNDPLTFEHGAQIIDLVPYHDPEIIVLMPGIGDPPAMLHGVLL